MKGWPNSKHIKTTAPGTLFLRTRGKATSNRAIRKAQGCTDLRGSMGNAWKKVEETSKRNAKKYRFMGPLLLWGGRRMKKNLKQRLNVRRGGWRD